jgi:CMP-N,N'-diacetyllegionaminic acid synthase
MVSILVTVCARGGSKGLPNKNLRPLLGRPLLVHTIEQALAWGRGRVVCSTDSDEIAQVARDAGAEVPFLRPPDLATDTAGKVPVIRHALAECEKDGARYEMVVDLDVTAPVRAVSDIEACVDAFRRSRPEVLFTVTRARKNPYFNMVERQPDGTLSVAKPLAGAVLRRQDAPQVYDINGCVYVYDAVALAAQAYPGVLQARFDVHEMAEDSAYDIDTAVDAVIVEALLRRRLRA